MSDWQPNSDLARTLWGLGFRCQPEQNIIVSRLDAWQRQVGFTWAYDVLCPAMQMIIDCEPIFYIYGGKDWMIELWKGQYGIETGAEIGVYSTAANPPSVQTVVDTLSRWLPAIAAGVKKSVQFFACVPASEQLVIQYTLKRNGVVLFQRGPESHWWLTGFMWGVFTEKPSDLVMDLEVTFPNPAMLAAFRGGLDALGYKGVPKNGTTSGLTSNEPKTTQPLTRVNLEASTQTRNRDLVRQYVELQAELGLLADDPQHSNDPNRFDVARITSARGKKAYQSILAFFGLLDKGKAEFTKIWRQH